MKKRAKYGNLRRITPQFFAYSSYQRNRGWLPRIQSWLSERALVVFVSMLLCLLLMSIACDRVLGSADSAVSGAGSGVRSRVATASTDRN